jgi:hypothetical protein
MKQKLFFTVFFFLMFFSHLLQAQNSKSDYLVRATMGTLSSSENVIGNNKQYVVQQSIGQASVIGTFYDSDYTLRQGFIQPSVLAKIIDSGIPLELEATVYPNPFVGSVTISFTEEISDNIELEVFDLLGRQVFSKTYLATQKLNLELSRLPVTSYILKLTANNKQFIKKLLKK